MKGWNKDHSGLHSLQKASESEFFSSGQDYKMAERISWDSCLCFPEWPRRWIHIQVSQDEIFLLRVSFIYRYLNIYSHLLQLYIWQGVVWIQKKGASGQKINYEVNNARNLTKFTTHYLDPSQIKVCPFLGPTPAPVMVKIGYMC